MGKFTVIKNEDFRSYCDEQDLRNFEEIAHKIQMGRIRNDKAPSNSYAIINLDEPYADEVIDIMRAHGHWGDYDWQNEGDRP